MIACSKPPTGWLCTKHEGHEGPCPTVRQPPDLVPCPKCGSTKKEYKTDIWVTCSWCHFYALPSTWWQLSEGRFFTTSECKMLTKILKRHITDAETQSVIEKLKSVKEERHPYI